MPSQLPHNYRRSTSCRVHCDEVQYITKLADRQFITVENTSYIDKHGIKQNGNNLYTVLPIQATMEYSYQQQLRRMEEQRQWQLLQKRLGQQCGNTSLTACGPLCALLPSRVEQPPRHGLTERFEPISMALRRAKEKAAGYGFVKG